MRLLIGWGLLQVKILVSQINDGIRNTYKLEFMEHILFWLDSQQRIKVK